MFNFSEGSSVDERVDEHFVYPHHVHNMFLLIFLRVGLISMVIKVSKLLGVMIITYNCAKKERDYYI